MKARDPRLAGQGAPPPPHFAKPPAGGPNSQQQRYRPNADPELRQQELLNNMQPKKRATGIPRTFLNLSGPSAPVEGGGEGGAATGEDGNGETTDNGDLATQLQPSAQAFQALVRSGGGQSLNDASKRRDLDYALKLTATSIPDHLQCGICHSIVKNAMLVPWDTEGRPTCESCIRDGLTKNGFTCPLTGTEGVSPDDLFPNVGLRKAADMFIADVMDKMDSIERQIEAENEEEEKKREAEALKRKDLEGNEFDDGGDGILTKRTKLNGKKSTNSTNDDLLFGGDDEFGGDVFDVAVDEDDEAEPEDMDEAIIEPVVDNTKPVISKEEGDGAATTGGGDTKKNDADNNNDQNNTSTNSDPQNSDDPNVTAAVKTNSDDQQGKKDDDDPSSPSKASTADASSSSSTPAQKEKRVRRAPPAGYVLGPAGSSASGASPSTVPNPNNMGGGNNPNMPPMHGNNPNMPPMNMGRGFGPGGRGNGPPQGRGYFPGNNGGRFPQQSFPPHMQQQQGNFPPQNGPGFNGGGPGFNNNGPDWNRKRGHEDMMMGQQQGGPPPNYQGPPQGRGGWGGRGFPNQQFGGRGPPGRGFQGRGYQGRGGFQGRGGRGNWGGRGRGGRW